MFQGLRANAQIYIVDRSNDIPKLSVGSVDKVTDPYSRYSTPNMPVMGQPIDAVVDVTIRMGDGTIELKKLPANQSVATPDGFPKVLVSDSRDAILAEVESIERISQGIVDGYDLNKNIVAACAEMKRTLNPQLAREQQRDEEIGELRNKIGGIESSLGNIEAMLRALNNGNAKNKKNNESD